MSDPARRPVWVTPLSLIAIFVASRILVVLVAGFVESFVPAVPGTTASTAPILRSLSSSDGFWYVRIAATGYHADLIRGPFHDYVFFPLYPFLIRVVSALTGGDLVLAGLAVSNVAFALALILFERSSRGVLGPDGAIVGSALLTFAPGAVAFALVYSDSVFLLLALATLAAARRGAWPLVGLLFALAALTRLPGVVLIVPLAILMGEQGGWRFRPVWLWLLSGPAALAGFLGYVWALTGDPLAWPRAQAAWNNPPDSYGPPGTPAIPTTFTLIVLIVVVAFYLFQLVYLRRGGLPRPEVGYTLASLASLAFAFRIVSLPRYLAVVWPFPWLMTKGRSRAFVAATVIAFTVAFTGFAFLDFTVVAP